MIPTTPGRLTTAVAEGAPLGILGTLGVKLTDAAGATVIGRTTDGIVIAAVNGATADYAWEFEAPETGLFYRVVWDHGDVTFSELVWIRPQLAGDGLPLDPELVRIAVASLMAYRLRVGGFASGRGGATQLDFDTETTPTLADAQEVSERNAALVADDFPSATDGDEPELRTIAALRTAIELESGTPNMDPERIRVWRDQLREYVDRVGDGTGGEGEPGPGEPGFRVLAPVWCFGPREADRAPGSEIAWEPRRTRRAW